MASASDTSGRPKRRVTSHDVARRAGVSQSTVSRALSGDPNVSEATRLRVTTIARKLNYAPDAIARSLITRNSRRIGVVVSDITNPFYPLLVEGLDHELSDLGYRMILFNGPDERPGQDPLDHVRSRAVDGLVFTSAVLGFPLADQLLETEVPVVFLNRHIDDDRFDTATSDNEDAARRVATLLVELRHERIALVSGPAQTSTARDRDRGFLQALAELGRPLDPSLHLSGPYDHETGRAAVDVLLARPDPPTAIFCGNDVIALGVWDAAVSAGLRIPQDVSIVGFDDIPMASWGAISLTTVRQPLTTMARASAELLVERLEGRFTGPGRARSFSTELIFRRTVGPRPG